MNRPGRPFLAAASLLVVFAAACGSPKIESAGTDPGTGTGVGGATGGGGKKGAGGAAGGFALPDAAPVSPTTPEEQNCASENRRAERVPMDLLLLIDVSSSMNNPGFMGKTKWQLALSALTTFIQDPKTVGIGVGMTYFPINLIKQGVPVTECDPAAYGKLAVPIADLPGVQGALITSLNAQKPINNHGTPTGPALLGSLDRLRMHLGANPTHRGALVVATDGEPTECGLDINAIVAPVEAAAHATPPIPTYAIGVFNMMEADRVRPRVEAIAAAGGAGPPFNLDPNEDLSKKLLEVLNQIRNAAVPCEYTIPTPSKGVLDYKKVNVHFKGMSGEDDLFYVAGPDRCDPMRGGWYYDADPETGAMPTRVIACPASCERWKKDTEANVELRFGCRTRYVP
jgi:hypothetical protein